MWARAVLLAAVLVLAPLGVRGADLVVWWDEGYYAEEDEAITEIIAALEQKTGKQVELVFHPMAEQSKIVQAAIDAGSPPDFLFGVWVQPRIEQWAFEARLEDFTVVLVWRYDRFARSTQALVNALMEFRALGVDFISYQENVDTTTPQGELVFGMMASLAQFESSLIGERVRAGMARARAEGKRISRPPIPEAKRRRIAELHRAGKSINRIHKELGIGYGTAWNYVRALEQA